MGAISKRQANQTAVQLEEETKMSASAARYERQSGTVFRRAIRACGLWLVFSLTLAPLALATSAAMLGVISAVGIALVREYGPVGLVLSVTGFAVSYAVAVGVHELGHVV